LFSLGINNSSRGILIQVASASYRKQLEKEQTEAETQLIRGEACKGHIEHKDELTFCQNRQELI